MRLFDRAMGASRLAALLVSALHALALRLSATCAITAAHASIASGPVAYAAPLPPAPRWVASHLDDLGLPTAGAPVLAAALDSTGLVWAGTPHGLFVHSGEAWQPVALDSPDTVRWLRADAAGLKAASGGTLYRIASPKSMPRAWVRGLPPILTALPDAGGGLWIGTRAGLYYAAANGHTANRVLGPDAPVSCLAFTHDQRLAVGTLGNGLWLRRASSDTAAMPDWEHHTCPSVGTVNALPGNYVHDLDLGGDDALWMTTSVGGLCPCFKACEFASRKGIIDPLHPHDGLGAAIANLRDGRWSVRYLLQDYELDKLDPSGLELLARVDLDRDGGSELWMKVCTGRQFGPRGLACFDEETGRQKFFLPSAGSPEAMLVFEREGQLLAVVNIHNFQQGARCDQSDDVAPEVWIVDAAGQIVSRTSLHPLATTDLIGPVASPHGTASIYVAASTRPVDPGTDAFARCVGLDPERIPPPGVWRLDVPSLRWIATPLVVEPGDRFFNLVVDIGGAELALCSSHRLGGLTRAVDLITGTTLTDATSDWPQTSSCIGLAAGPMRGTWSSLWCSNRPARVWTWSGGAARVDIPFGPSGPNVDSIVAARSSGHLPAWLAPDKDGRLEIWEPAPLTAEQPRTDQRVPLPALSWAALTRAGESNWRLGATVGEVRCVWDAGRATLDGERLRVFTNHRGEPATAIVCGGELALFVNDANGRLILNADPWPERTQPRDLRWLTFVDVGAAAIPMPFLLDEHDYPWPAIRCTPEGRATGPRYEIQVPYTNFRRSVAGLLDVRNGVLGTERDLIAFSPDDLSQTNVGALELVAGRPEGAAAIGAREMLVWGEGGVGRLWQAPRRVLGTVGEVYSLAQLGDTICAVAETGAWVAGSADESFGKLRGPLASLYPYDGRVVAQANALWILGAPDRGTDGYVGFLTPGAEHVHDTREAVHLGGNTPAMYDVLAWENGELYATSAGLLARQPGQLTRQVLGNTTFRRLARIQAADASPRAVGTSNSVSETAIALGDSGRVWQIAAGATSVSLEAITPPASGIVEWVQTDAGLLYVTNEGRLGLWPRPPAWQLPAAAAPDRVGADPGSTAPRAASPHIRLSRGSDADAWVSRGGQLLRLDFQGGFLAPTSIPGLPHGEILALLDMRDPLKGGAGDLFISIAGSGLTRLYVPPRGGRTVARIVREGAQLMLVGRHFAPSIPAGSAFVIRRASTEQPRVLTANVPIRAGLLGRGAIEAWGVDAFGRPAATAEHLQIPLLRLSRVQLAIVVFWLLALGVILALWSYAAAGVGWLALAAGTLGLGLAQVLRLAAAVDLSAWSGPLWALLGASAGLVWRQWRARKERSSDPRSEMHALLVPPTHSMLTAFVNCLNREPQEASTPAGLDDLRRQIRKARADLATLRANMRRLTRQIPDMEGIARAGLAAICRVEGMLAGTDRNDRTLLKLISDRGRRRAITDAIDDMAAELRLPRDRALEMTAADVGRLLESHARALRDSLPWLQVVVDVQSTGADVGSGFPRPSIPEAALVKVLGNFTGNAVRHMKARHAVQPQPQPCLRLTASVITVDASQRRRMGDGLASMVAGEGGAIPDGQAGDPAQHSVGPSSAGTRTVHPIGRWIVIGVEDNGTGFTREAREEQFGFDPLPPDSPRRRNGLFEARRILNQHKGGVELAWNEEERGARIEFRLKLL